MVDEFQDTSRVQMRILERLAGVNGNIVVPSETMTSQSTASGAPACPTCWNSPTGSRAAGWRQLTTNYRSHWDIVAAVGRWMNSAARWQPDDRSFRYAKDIVPRCKPGNHPDYPAVISVQGQEPGGEAAQLAGLLRFLKDQRGHCRVRTGGAAAPQRQGRGERPIPGRSGTGRRGGPLRARRARPYCTRMTRCWSPPSTRPRAGSGMW